MLHRSFACCQLRPSYVSLLFFNHTAPTDIYTLSLHDALPIWNDHCAAFVAFHQQFVRFHDQLSFRLRRSVESHELLMKGRSEEHTSELQSHSDLVCRLLLEKKKRTERRTPRKHDEYDMRS